jgi:hypothetical protein
MAGPECGVIRWEEPPEAARQQRAYRPWSLIAAELRSRPHTSALVAEGTDPSTAARINNGTSWFAPAGAFQAVSRHVDGVGICVWAKYVGDDAP